MQQPLYCWFLPAFKSHILIFLSHDPLTKSPLSKTINVITLAKWPCIVCFNKHVSTFQILIVVSHDPLARSPLGRRTNDETHDVCPFIVLFICSPVLLLQIRMVLSYEQLAKSPLTKGTNAETPEVWPVKTFVSW